MMYKFTQTAEINFCYIYSSKTRSEMMLLSKEQPYKTRNEPSCRCALGCALISFEADLADSPTSIRSSDLPSSLLSLSPHLLRRLASASAIHRSMISVSPSDVRSVTVEPRRSFRWTAPPQRQSTAPTTVQQSTAPPQCVVKVC